MLSNELTKSGRQETCLKEIQDIYKEIHRAIAKQILSTNDEKWNTIPKAYSELDTLRVKYEEEKDEERLAMMNDLNKFLEEIENKYQDA